jgi:TonB-linked SusC/RagA family outer membrane protein
MIKNLLLLSCFLLFMGFAASAQRIVTGTVLDESGGALPGVNILLKGTTTGTVTGSQGTYSISIPENQTDGVLLISFIGYSSQEVPIAGRSIIDVSLLPDVQTLGEVVVVGYGTQKREDISGAVTSVHTKDLPQVANTSVNQLLQGRVPGLNIAQRSAQPGGGLNVNIRGAISQRGSNAPLYVIDGVPIFNNDRVEQGLVGGQLGFDGGADRDPLNSINPADIESIDVLKDASATAIYGSSAANGVILITTKRGKQGPAQVQYRGSYTIQSPKKYIEFFRAKEFMQQHNRLAHDYYLYSNDLGPYGNADPAAVSPFTPFFSTADLLNYTGKGTDWLDLMIRNGKIAEHNFSISGGNENTRIYTAFNYFNNDAILENSNLRRYTGRMNLDQKIGGRIKLGLNLTASQINNNNVSSGANSGGSEKYNMLQAAYSYSPLLEVFDENGKYTKTYDTRIINPASFLILNDKSVTTRMIVAPNVEVKIFDALKLNIVGGIDRQNSQRSFYIPASLATPAYPTGAAQKSNANIGNYTGETYLTFDKKVGQGALSIVAGGGLYRTTTDQFNIDAVTFFTDAFQDNNIDAATGKTLSSFASGRSERNRQSLFGRINYSLKDKYIVTFTGRMDGDSEFAANNKFGFFPGLSVAWRISNENFLSGVSQISDLKLRVGAGRVGNPLNAGSAIDLIGLNPTDPQNQYTYPVGGAVLNGVSTLQRSNPNLTWETNETINIGLDFGLFNDRVSGALDVYQRTAKDLLDEDRLVRNNEVFRIPANIGSTRSQGIELMLTTVNLAGPLTWSTTFTGTTFKSYWVERNLAVTLPDWVKKDDPLSAVYGWETDGIITGADDRPSYMPNANPGNIKYIDQNNDGQLNGSDVVMLGQRTPKWNIGLANSFSYKGIDLNFYFSGFFGNIASTNSLGMGFNPNSPGDRLAGINGSSIQNVPTYVRRVWTADNPTGDLPGLAPDMYAGNNPSTNTNPVFTNPNFENHNFYAQRADFVRLRNITLGYTLSKNLLGKAFIRSARIFIDLQNVAKLTKFDGFDPEFTEINPYPQALSTTIGVNVGF